MVTSAQGSQKLSTGFLLFRAIATLGLSWFRWTQLSFMLAAWGFAALMVLALFLLVDVEQTESGLESFMVWVLNAPIIGPWIRPYLIEGGKEIEWEAVKSGLLWIWTGVSLLMAALSALAARLWGPFTPWTLKRKLGLTVASCLLLVLLFALAVSGHNINNETAGSPWITGALMFFMLMVISAWAVTVSHIAGLIIRGLENAEPVPTDPAPPGSLG